MDFVDSVKCAEMEILSEAFGIDLSLFALRMPIATLQAEAKDGLLHHIISETHKDYEAVKQAYDCMGRSMEVAFRLIRNEDEIFDMVDLRLIFGRSESDIKRVKGRIIGADGKTRRLIEELTEADVVVYGHTVGLIGSFEQVDAAHNAVQMIVEGCQHHTVYNYLQKKRTELKKQKLELWEKPKSER